MSPRSPEQFEALRAESRALLMETALRLFARHGYARTSIRLIAQEAGVSQGLLYNYFPGKAELLRAIYAEGMRGVEESFGRMREGGSALERLEDLVRSSIEIVRRDEEFWRLFYGLRFQRGLLEELGESLAGWSGAILRTLESLLRQAGVPEPEAEARVLFATIDGLAQHALLDPEGYPVDAAVAAVLRRFPERASG